MSFGLYGGRTYAGAIDQISLTATDSASALDAPSSDQIAGSDTAAAADAVADLIVSKGDSASGADSATNLALTNGDSASAADAPATIRLTAADTATVADFGSASVGPTIVNGADSASAADAATVTILGGTGSHAGPFITGARIIPRRPKVIRAFDRSAGADAVAITARAQDRADSAEAAAIRKFGENLAAALQLYMRGDVDLLELAALVD